MTPTPPFRPVIDSSFPVACEVGAIPIDARDRWIETGKAIYAAVEEVLELPDGYALRFTPEQLMLVAEYVSRDRLCCAFAHWSIVLEQGGGPLWLSMEGPEGTKDLLRQVYECTDLLSTPVAQAAGFRTSSRTPFGPATLAALAKPSEPETPDLL